MNSLLILMGIAYAGPAQDEAQSMVSAFARYGDETPAQRLRPWWSQIEDPGLRTVLKEGLAANPDLLIADARVQLARAGTVSAISGLLPSVAFEVATQEAPTDGMGLNPAAASMPDYGSAFESLGALLGGLATATGIDPTTVPDFSSGSTAALPETYRSSSTMLKGSWVLDVFGRQTMSTLAAHKDARAALRNRDAGMRGIAGQIGSAWYDLVAARQQVKIIEDQVRSARELLELVELRYENGEGTAIDVLQQRQQVARTEAMLPRAIASRVATHGRVAIAIGLAPSTDLPESDDFPALGPAPSIGSPSRLVHDRSDIQAAVHQLESARLKRNASVSALLPTLTLTGQYGRQYLTLDDTEDLDTWGVGAVATVPLFAGGRTHAGIKAAKAGRDVATIQLRAAVLSAVQQVEAAIASDSAAIQTLEAVNRQAEAAAIALDQARIFYLQGLTPYLSVLAAQTANQAAQLSQVDARRGRMLARIQLHSALGGTWLPTVEDSP
jgi:outer membrane protein TolC